MDMFLYWQYTCTVNSEIFARNVLSRIALKDLFVTLKICDFSTWFSYISKCQIIFAISRGFYFHKTSHMRSFAEKKNSQKLLNLQYFHIYCSLIWTLTLETLRKKCIWKCRLLSRLLQIIVLHYWRIKYRSKQRGPRTDCSYRSSLIWVHTVCHRGFLNISADEKKQTTFVAH